MLSLVETCSKRSSQQIIKFYVDSKVVGYIPTLVFDYIKRTKPKCFLVDSDVHLVGDLNELLSEWRNNNVFECLKGWRNESFQIFGTLQRIERAAVGLFGCRSYGCHINGLVDGKMWIARRSFTKPTFPGKLDNLTGGGLTSGTPLECAIKECKEEAGIPLSITKSLVNAGVITFWYTAKQDECWTAHTEYIYDLELPKDFTPVPEDGEVECFYLWDIDTIKKALLNNEFSPEAALVIIDYFIRKGILTPENEPDYLTICSLIRQELPFPGPRFPFTKA